MLQPSELGGWTAVIAIAVAVMAVVQLLVLAGLLVAWRRAEARLLAFEQRTQAALDEVTPRVAAALDEARGASASLRALTDDLQHRLGVVDNATQSVRTRVDRVADSVQWAATNLPLPARMSGPAAIAAWAGTRIVRALLDRARANRARQIS